jgi:putative peptide zinc metalloprotease protein
VEVRIAELLDQIFPAVIKREVPGAVERLPSTALGSAGGGEIPIEPWDKEGVKTLEKLFQFDIELPSTVDGKYIGGRVFVRFDHGFEPLAFQWYRSLRLLFMRRFNV